MNEETTTDARARGRQSRERLRRIFDEARVIAVVGASDDLSKPAGYVPAYLQSQGYRIIPVNPRRAEVLGEPTRASLSEIDVPVDVVDVFRRPSEAVDIAREAATIKAPVIWFQPGTHSAEALRLADEHGMVAISRICMGATHGTLGLGPGPDHAEEDQAPPPAG